jgi:hypothetical protein
VPLRRVSIRVVRSAGVVLAAIVAAILLSFTTAKSAMGATAIFIGGIGEPMLYEPIMGMALGGKYAEYNRVSFDWPAQAYPTWGQMTLGQSVTQGTQNLYTILTNPSLPTGTVVIGSSAGSLVVDETLRLLDNSGVDKSKVSFVVIADGSRQDSFQAGSLLFSSLSGYTYQAAPVTKYDVDVVTYEYDGFADFPDRWWNLTAVANSVAGMLLLHNATYFADLSKLPFTTTENAEGGFTKRYLIPAQTLPLVQMNPWLAPMEETLKQMIDTGYSRNDQTALASSAAQISTATLQGSTSALDQPNNSLLADTGETPGNSDNGTANALAAASETPGDSTDGTANAQTDAGTPVSQRLEARAERAANRAADLTRGNAVNPTADDSSSPANDSASRRTVRSLPHPVRDIVRSTVKGGDRGLGELTGGSKASANVAGDSSDPSAETKKQQLNRSAADDSGTDTGK